MKRIVSASLALVVLAPLVIVLTTSKPVYAQGECSVATLKGNYGFSQPGFEPRGRIRMQTNFPSPSWG